MEPKIVCAWCGVILREGDLPVFHGICEACSIEAEKEVHERPIRYNEDDPKENR